METVIGKEYIHMHLISSDESKKKKKRDHQVCPLISCVFFLLFVIKTMIKCLWLSFFLLIITPDDELTDNYSLIFGFWFYMKV
mmetsp:Transcript_11587/g.15770  ORF Transcript_11587/g.15770 Transcript_11587/m.15770 type:complete len:83 (+) Transcript_11587:167-415(+)